MVHPPWELGQQMHLDVMVHHLADNLPAGTLHVFLIRRPDRRGAAEPAPLVPPRRTNMSNSPPEASPKGLPRSGAYGAVPAHPRRVVPTKPRPS
jgi:hypothetical protein